MTNPPETRVETITLKEDLSHQGKVVLRYRIQYPRFYSRRYATAASRVNEYHRRRALAFQRYCRKKLFHCAVEQFEFSMANHYPLMTYEAERKFECTFLTGCTVSLYTDTYLFTGGAHGATTRQSDTWSFRTGRQVPITAFFSRPNYQAPLFAIIGRQIEKRQKDSPGAYFDNYPQAIREEFQPQQFYLTGKGLVVYYQQYDIAPYSTGIPTFLIPYGGNFVVKPRCGRMRQ